MSWQLLILLSVFTYSVSVLLQRVLVKNDKSDPVAFSIVFQLVTAAFIGIYGSVSGVMRFPNLTPYIPNLLFMTLLYSLGNYFIFTALKNIEASKFSIIFSSRALFTVFASTVFLQEALGTGQWVGAICIFGGIILVSGNTRWFSFSKVDWYPLMAAVCFGLAVTNDRFVLNSFPVFPYVFIGFLTPAIGIAFLKIRSVRHVPILLSRGMFWKILLLCAIYAISAMTFYIGLQISSNSSQVITVNLTSIIVIVLLSIIFLKERTDWQKKIIGASLSFIGLILVS